MLVAIGPGAVMVAARTHAFGDSGIALAWLLGSIGDYGATLPGLPLAQSFVVDMGFSGVLAFVIMGVATDERAAPAVAPFAIGATVFAGALVTGPLTGGSFNPARSLGPAVASGLWTAHWLYWAAPIAGMMLGMRLYDLLRPGEQPVPAGQVVGTEGPI